MKTELTETVHKPILLQTICDALLEKAMGALAAVSPDETAVFVDCTFGGGGHSGELLKRLKNSTKRTYRVIGFDRDPDAISRGKSRFSQEMANGHLELIHSPFSRLPDFLSGQKIFGALADLGVSSDQIDSRERGFSFRFPAPLDMRMNTTDGETLAEYLARVEERELTDVIFEFGEERFSRQIARRLVGLRARGEMPKDTVSLAEQIKLAMPPAQRHSSRIHPATRTFQALRIVLNQELLELEKVLPAIADRLVPGGRMALLTFHSLEDRIVKNFVRSREDLEPFTKKPIDPTDEEISENPRARSAKLRVATKI